MDRSIPLDIVEHAASTNAVLRARAEAGGAEQALLARRQSAGRGRLGRVWQSVPGNLYLSVLLRPAGMLQPGHWASLAAVAVTEAVAEIRPALTGRISLKWPNDVLLAGGKLAGVLIEADGAAGWLVAGFGVNLAAGPAGLDRPVASLGAAVAPEAFAEVLLASVQRWQHRYAAEGYAPVRDAWLARGPALGAPVAAGAGAQRVAGEFAGLREDGALLIAAGAGVRAITSGEVE